MTYSNPTPLCIGMAGRLAGIRFHVVGRLVLGMTDATGTYYWNEFHLKDTDGNSATLVYEATERGGEWKLFKLFRPAHPLTVEQAAAKRVGDRINLDGERLRITLVDESRVYHIEGEAPEGVHVGEIARYFNVEEGNKMQVVSWIGNKIEFYRGMKLQFETVGKAFNFTERPHLRHVTLDRATDLSNGKTVTAWGIIIALFVFIAWGNWDFSSNHAALEKITLRAPTLTLGSAGQLNGKSYRISSHELVEVSEPTRCYEQHEYNVFDEEGHVALLIYGFGTGATNWFLFRETTGKLNQSLRMASLQSALITPQEAATLQRGTGIYFQDKPEKISQLFRATIRKVEGNQARKDAVFYGFKATGFAKFARWNEAGIAFYQGEICTEKNIETLFKR